MKIKLGQLRKLFRDGMDEAKVGASPAYMKKEAVREVIQSALAEAIGTGKIGNEDDLKHFFDVAPLALDALKMVPFEVYQKISGAKPKSR